MNLTIIAAPEGCSRQRVAAAPWQHHWGCTTFVTQHWRCTKITASHWERT